MRNYHPKPHAGHHVHVPSRRVERLGPWRVQQSVGVHLHQEQRCLLPPCFVVALLHFSPLWLRRSVPDACPPPVVSEITKNSCRVDWTEAEENGGPTTGYQVFYAGKGYKIGRSQRHFIATNLMSDRVYQFSVACCNMHGWGPASELSDPIRTQSSAPDAPTGVFSPNQFITSMDVQWQAPLETWGSRIIGYRVLWRVEGAADDFGANDCSEDFTLAQLELRRYEPRLEEEGGPDVRYVCVSMSVRLGCVCMMVLDEARKLASSQVHQDSPFVFAQALLPELPYIPVDLEFWEHLGGVHGLPLTTQRTEPSQDGANTSRSILRRGGSSRSLSSAGKHRTVSLALGTKLASTEETGNGNEDGDGGGAKAEGCVLAWCLAPSSPFPHAFVESCWHICAPSGCAPRRWNRKQQPRSRRQPPLDLMLTRTTQLSSSAPTTTW